MGSIPGWGTSPGEGNGKFLLVGRIYLLINVLCVCVCVCACVYIYVCVYVYVYMCVCDPPCEGTREEVSK